MSAAKVIAIDGPSGSGKSTIAKIIAQKLNLTYLDTGAMFRGIAYGLDLAGIDVSETNKISDFLTTMNLSYAPATNILIELNGANLTDKIREHHVSALASKYSQISEIRNFLKEFQRQIANTKASVLEGRDIGTVIFPDAALKIFLTADPRVRAERRYHQLIDLGQDVTHTSIEKIADDIAKRDREDSKREIAPLVKAGDAVEIDTTSLSIEQVIEKIISLYHQRQELF